MNAIWALARKDILLLIRDKAGLFFAVIFPVLYAIFFGSTIGGGGGGGGPGKDNRMAILVVDEDHTDGSRAFVETLTKADEFEVKASESLAGAETEVGAGNYVAFLRLEKGFGEGQSSLFTGGGKSVIEIGTDPSKKAEVGMLQGLIQKYAFQGLGRAFTDPAAGRKQLDSARAAIKSSDWSVADKFLFDQFFGHVDSFYTGLDKRNADRKAEGTSGGGFDFAPVTITSRAITMKRSSDLPTNGFTLAFPQGIIWGLMGAAMGFAVSFVVERSAGTYTRLIASPLSPMGVVLGKALACFVVCVGVSTLMLFVGRMLGVSITTENLPRVVLAVLATAVYFVGVMMLVAALAKTERGAGGIGWAVMMLFAFSGGAAIPAFVFPSWMRAASQFSPVYWALRNFECALWRPVGFSAMIPGLAILFVIGFVGLFIGARLIARRA